MTWRLFRRSKTVAVNRYIYFSFVLTELPEIFHALYQMDFLLRKHPCKDLAFVDDGIEQGRVMSSNQAESLAITRKRITVMREGAQQKVLWNKLQLF